MPPPEDSPPPRIQPDPPRASQVVLDNIENMFTHHPPFGDQVARYYQIREHAKMLAKVAANNSPMSREQSLGLTHLQQAVMWFNAAIACNEKPPPAEQPPQ